MQKLLLVIKEQAKDFVSGIKDMMIFFACIAGLLVALAAGIGALCLVLFPRTTLSYAAYYAGEFWDNMHYEALQEAQSEYEAVDKANAIIAEFEAKQQEAKEAFEYAQGQIYADKEKVRSYTLQLEQVLQSQQKAIRPARIHTNPDPRIPAKQI